MGNNTAYQNINTINISISVTVTSVKVDNFETFLNIVKGFTLDGLDELVITPLITVLPVNVNGISTLLSNISFMY